MRIIAYFSKRLAAALLTMLGVTAIVFFALHLLPGGYAEILLGPFATPAARKVIALRYGLDQPLLLQYVHWVVAVAHGNLGTSMVTRAPVAAQFLHRAPVTLELSLLALAFVLAIGIPLGVVSGTSTADSAGGALSRVIGRLVGAFGASVPDFVLGTILIFVFSVWSLWFRVGGYVPFFKEPVANLRVMLLPAMALSVFGIALVLRTTRDAVLRVMTEGYITAAVARGERPLNIIRLHVLRNAAIPVVTVVTTYFGFLLGGTVVLEVLFSIPGIGLYTFNGLENRDYAVVQAGVLISAAVFVTINMLADLAYVLIDPRIGGGAT